MNPELYNTASEALKAFRRAFEKKTIVGLKDLFAAVDAGGDGDGWPDELLVDADNNIYINYYYEVYRVDNGKLSKSIWAKIEPNGTITEFERVPEVELEDITDYLPDIDIYPL